MRRISGGHSQMMIIDHFIDRLLTSPLPESLFLQPQSFLVGYFLTSNSLSLSLSLSCSGILISSLQKLTWKSRQADVDTCRMKGKHKVRKIITDTSKHCDRETQTYSHKKSFSSLKALEQCRQARTHVMSRCLSQTSSV